METCCGSVFAFTVGCWGACDATLRVVVGALTMESCCGSACFPATTTGAGAPANPEVVVTMGGC